MSIQGFFGLVAGKMQQIIALVVSSGAADAGRIVATGNDGRLDPTVMPVGIGANTKPLPAYEALSAGDYVNEFLDSGVLKVRKADATASGKEADGYVLAAAASGATATVYPLSGSNTQLTGLTVGSTYYLATTPGGVTDTAPSGAGNFVQKLGKAITTTEIIGNANDPYYLA